MIEMISQPSNQLGAGRQYGRRLASGCCLPLGKSSSSLSKHNFQGRVWCLASGGVVGREGRGGDGREQCSPEQPVSLLWQVIKFEMPTQCTLGTGVVKMSRNSQTLCSSLMTPLQQISPPLNNRWTGGNDMCHLGFCLMAVFLWASCSSICLDLCIRPVVICPLAWW